MYLSSATTAHLRGRVRTAILCQLQYISVFSTRIAALVHEQDSRISCTEQPLPDDACSCVTTGLTALENFGLLHLRRRSLLSSPHLSGSVSNIGTGS